MTLPTGRAFTTIRAVPDLPSLEPVIVTTPACAPTTSPEADTVAMAELLEAHDTGRSGSGLPIESRGTAVSCVVCPTTTASTAGEICNEETGTGNTVTPTDALRDSLVAVIVVTPAASPVSNPVLSMEATNGLLVCQNTERPANTSPLSPNVTDDSCNWPPTRMLGLGGLTRILATARAVTLSVATALRPCTLTAMRTVPTRIPVTSPSGDTRAIVESLVVHNTVRSTTVLPLPSRTRACKASVLPTLSCVCVAGTSTDATTPGTSVGPVNSLKFAQAGSKARSNTFHQTPTRVRMLSTWQRDTRRARMIGACAITKLTVGIESPAPRITV